MNPAKSTKFSLVTSGAEHMVEGMLNPHGPKIFPVDEFTGRYDLSYGQRKRLRRALRGLCRDCNTPVTGAVRCPHHAEAQRRKARARYARKKAEQLRVYGMSALKWRQYMTRLSKTDPTRLAALLIG